MMLQPTFNYKDYDLTDKNKFNRWKSPWICCVDRLTVSIQNYKNKFQSNIFENIFEAAHHQISTGFGFEDSGFACHLTETATLLDTTIKKHIQQFILPKGIFLSNC